MTINIEHEAEPLKDIDEEAVVRRVIEEAADYENCPYEIEVNVLFTDNESIRELNREYRGIDLPTDVLSFPMADYPAPADFSLVDESEEEYFNPETGELVLGDIVLSVDRIRSQSLDYGHSIMRELAFLTAHSMLHLFGYDHIEPDEAAVMEKRQEEILQRLKITR